MSALRVLIAVAVLLIGRPSWALGGLGGGACNSVLVDKTVSFQDMSQRSELAWLSLIDAKSFERHKDQINGFVPGAADGSFDRFVEKRKLYFSVEGFASDEFQASQDLLAEAKEATDAFEDCIRATRGNGLFAYAKDVAEGGATIVVVWHPANGGRGPVRVELALSGVKADMASHPSVMSPGETAFPVTRRFGEEIRGSVRAGGAGNAAPIYVPISLTVGPQPQAPCVKLDGSAKYCVECSVSMNDESLEAPGIVPLRCGNLQPGKAYVAAVLGTIAAKEPSRAEACWSLRLKAASGDVLARDSLCVKSSEAGDHSRVFSLLTPAPISVDGSGNVSQEFQVECTQGGTSAPCRLSNAHWRVCAAGTYCK